MSIFGRFLGGSKKDATPPSSPDIVPATAMPVPTAPAEVVPAGSREQSDGLILDGQQLEDSGDLAGAEDRYRAAIAAAPSYPRAHLNLGNALQKLGRLREAADAHHAALDIDPDYAGAHFNLGAVLIDLGDIATARDHFERALELNPKMADAAILLARACEAAGDPSGAREHLERALAIDPAHAGAAANLGTLLTDLGEPDAAERNLRRALELDSDLVPALIGMARLKVNSGQPVQADALYRAALRLDPDNAELHSAFLFSLNLRDDLTAEAVAREHFAFGERFGRGSSAAAAVDRPSSRIRVGYVSADLSNHPVALFLRPVLAHHDPSQFEVFCYSNSNAEAELTAKLRETCEHWRMIAGRSDAWVEDLVRNDGIDILVDLSGHTVGNRLGVFARRPATVHATWLGYLNTTGLEEMDYRICDHRTDPRGETESLNSEGLARMPHSQWCYQPVYDITPTRTGIDASRPVVFGSFNQFVKISDACLDLWAAVLREVPDSELRIHDFPAWIDAGEFLARLEHRGVERARVGLRARAGYLEYFAAIEDVDIALDSVPYNGATTTLDTLWMGTPVVGLRGERSISRSTYSILGAAGLPELVAEDAADYVARNVGLARDAEARLALRHTLRTRLEASPLMDATRFVKDLEALYRRMLE